MLGQDWKHVMVGFKVGNRWFFYVNTNPIWCCLHGSIAVKRDWSSRKILFLLSTWVLITVIKRYNDDKKAVLANIITVRNGANVSLEQKCH